MHLFFALLLLLQQPAPARTTITGQVVQAETTPTVPIESARVELSQGTGPKIVRTDAQGRFRIADINPGQYTLKVMADGFAAAEYGQPAFKLPGKPLTIGGPAPIEPLNFKMVRAATVAGRVLDFDSEPIAGALIAIYKSTYGPNGRRLIVAGYTRSDDRGEYRLYWMTPDEYYIAASYTSARLGPLFVPINNNTLPAPNGYPPMFYRNAPDSARAEKIQLKPGEQRNAVDFQMMRVPVVNIRGTITDGRTGRGVAVPVLLSGVSEIQGGLSFQGQSDAAGKYELSGIPSGTYRMLVQQVTLAGSTAMRSLDVGTQDILGYDVVIEPGVSVKGRIVTDDGAPLPSLGRPTILLAPALGTLASGGSPRLFQPSGEFEILNVQKGSYNVVSSGWPEDFYMKSATFGRADALSAPISISGEGQDVLEVVLSSGTGRVTGTIAASVGGPPFSGAQVVLVPEEKLRDKTALYKTAITDQNGGFSFRSIPPGNYSVFAWDYVESGALYSRDFLKPYESAAAPVQVEAKSESAVRMQVIPHLK